MTLPHGKLTETTIDGEPARIVSFGPGGSYGRFVVAVHVPANYEPGPKLTLEADCESREATEFALPLFRSIRLP